MTRKILIIHHDRVARDIIKMTISTFSFAHNIEFLEASNGTSGYKLIQTANPKLIFLNWVLPRMSGLEVYQEMQKDPELRLIPLIWIVYGGLKQIKNLTEIVPDSVFWDRDNNRNSYTEKKFLADLKKAIAKVKK